VPAQPRLPISHTIHLVPFFRFLGEVGAPVERGVERAKLPAHVSDMPDCYAPTESVWAFIGGMARKEGIDDLGLRVAYFGGLRMLGHGLTTDVEQSPTLLAGIESFCKVIHRESSEMACWLVQDQDEARFHLHKTFEPEVLGYQQTEWLGLIAMLTAIQVFAGPDWQPVRISVRSKGPIPRLAHELFPDTQLLSGQREIYIAFPRSALSLGRAPQHSDPRFERPSPPTSRLTDEEPPSDFAQRLRLCLEPHLLDGYPDIHLAAEVLDTSTRTLQRRLAGLGMSYSAVVQGARFQLSRRMLLESDSTISDIAHTVGYSDASHFARAFRRLAGVTPREYRSQAMEAAE
jgi:AraC-like DNA-binding protein